jgi:hypothetical protein
MTCGPALEAIHPAVEATIDTRNAEGFVALYAPTPAWCCPDGSTATPAGAGAR